MEQKAFTFEQLPTLVMQLTDEVSGLKDLLLSLSKQVNKEEVNLEKFLTIQEASKVLNLTTSTLYSKVSKREIPSFKQGNRLYFSSIELTEYLKQGKKKTFAEIEAMAETYLSNNKKGL